MFGYTFFLTFKYRPFENKLMNFLTIVNEASYIIILFLYLGLYAVPSSSMTPKSKYVYFGWTLCLLVAVTILINIGVCVMEMVKAAKGMCKKKKKTSEEN